MFRELIVDPEFEKLIPPLSADELRLLRENLIREGCRDPITIWNGIILDGHNRYRICRENWIPFRTYTVTLESRDEAIVWICKNQMGRRNLSEERRKYLIGKQYEAEKRIGTRNPDGRNQYTKDCPTLLGNPQELSHNLTARRIGNRYNISHTTVEKYNRYSKAIDRIKKASEKLGEDMLSGDVKVSHDNTLYISELEKADIQEVATAVERDGMRSLNAENMPGADRRMIKPHITSHPKHSLKPKVTVKDMPVPDPDSVISGLTYTIASWRFSIDRVRNTDEYPAQLSSQAKGNFRSELMRLRVLIDQCLKETGEERGNDF